MANFINKLGLSAKKVKVPKEVKLPKEVGVPGASLSRVEVLSFKKVPFDRDGRTPNKTFTLPSDAISVTIVAKCQSDTNLMVTKLKGPDATDLVSEDLGMVNSPNRSSQSVVYGVAVLLAPNNPQVKIRPGQYEFQVSGRQANGTSTGAVPTSTIDVDVLVKRAPKQPKKGRFNLNLFFTGAYGLTSRSARNDAGLAKALDELRRNYGRAGIEVGTITYQDAPDRFRQINVDPGGNLGEMFATTRQSGINVFFVERLGSSALFPMSRGADGASAGVPGSPLPGTTGSGIAIALEMDHSNIPATLTHEIGHFLGLSHTAENNGTNVHDQIPDTLEYLSGNDNLMFPLKANATARFSPQQAQVLLGSPLVEILE